MLQESMLSMAAECLRTCNEPFQAQEPQGIRLGRWSSILSSSFDFILIRVIGRKVGTLLRILNSDTVAAKRNGAPYL